MRTRLSVVSVCAVGALCYCAAAPSGRAERKVVPLTAEEKLKYEKLAREWMTRLWTNDYSQVKATVYAGRGSDTQDWLDDIVRIEMKFPVAGRQNKQSLQIHFRDKHSEKVEYIINSAYAEYVPTREEYVRPTQEDLMPKFTTEEQARKKAEEHARMLGVPDLLNPGKFDLRSASFTQKTWLYAFTARINGYPSLYGVSIAVADTPRMELQSWQNMMDIPESLPANAVLTAEQAQGKAEKYLKQYFPLKDALTKITFVTNRVEYAAPNYHYIRPADASGFSGYIPKKDETTLIWVNYFKCPPSSPFGVPTPVLIYVDAVTGEMLGGAD